MPVFNANVGVILNHSSLKKRKPVAFFLLEKKQRIDFLVIDEKTIQRYIFVLLKFHYFMNETL